MACDSVGFIEKEVREEGQQGGNGEEQVADASRSLT